MFFNAPFFVKDFVEVDVTRVSFEFSDLESSVRENIEADSFWCMTKVIVINLSFRLIYGLHLQVLDGIQDNYTFAQPGIQTKIRCCECEHAPRKKTSCSQIPTLAHVFRFAISDITSWNRQLEELQKRVDLTLHTHIVNRDVQYLQFSFRSNYSNQVSHATNIDFRWMNNLLLRELPLNATIRLWDTYLAEPDGFRWFHKNYFLRGTNFEREFCSKFHLYVCAAFLKRWKSELEQKKDFQGILLFIQVLVVYFSMDIINTVPEFCHDQWYCVL